MVLVSWERPLLGEIPKVLRGEKGQIIVLGQTHKVSLTFYNPVGLEKEGLSAPELAFVGNFPGE